MAALLRELLAVKLNIAAAAALGENLLDALVYASTESVAEVVAMSDALVVTGTNLCGLDATMIAEIQRMAEAAHKLTAQRGFHRTAPPSACGTPSRDRPLRGGPSHRTGLVGLTSGSSGRRRSRRRCCSGVRGRPRVTNTGSFDCRVGAYFGPGGVSGL
jgi:hypothetical protein